MALTTDKYKIFVCGPDNEKTLQIYLPAKKETCLKQFSGHLQFRCDTVDFETINDQAMTATFEKTKISNYFKTKYNTYFE